MRAATLWMVTAAGLGLLAEPAHGQEDPPAAEVTAEGDREAPGGPSGSAASDEVVELPEVVVRPPRIHAGPGEAGVEEAVTPSRALASTFDVPAAASVVDGADVRRRQMARTLPDALMRLPSVMVQKTGPLQSSPFIRGFTGYRNLLLIDGIRFNNSAFRDGPNQYWSTIDTWSVERIEVVRGPGSVLWGSDAVGGVVNVIPIRRRCFACGTHLGGTFGLRAGSADQAFAARLGIEGNRDNVGWIGGFTWKTYGDIESGGGKLPGTGGIEEVDGDLRFDVRLHPAWRLTLGYQHVGQEDAPRTHTTVDAVPFHGTTIGSELRRDHDQRRDLAYARVTWEPGTGPVPEAFLGVSLQRTWEERDRLRTGLRRDLSGFELYQTGVQLQVRTPTRIGELTWGADWYHDDVDSWRDDYVAGVLTKRSIQGPLGDDGTYDLFGAYVQDELTLGCVDLIAGVRFTYASAHADRVEDPDTGDVIQVDDDWTNVVGSLGAVWHVGPRWNVYGSVAQAFRAPTLYDLTSFEATSVFESPTPGLDPEQYVSFELGVKTAQPRLSAYAATWTTLLQDTIIRSPTGGMVDGAPEVRKDNVGDGWLFGVEAEAIWQAAPAWQVFANVSWMDGEVDEIDETTLQKVRSPASRMKPLALYGGVRYEPPGGRVWAQLEALWWDAEDRLSLRDRTDTQRIPPGGTPSWAVVSLRGGLRITPTASVTLALENLFDENYRVHGSGQNEPGFGVVLGLDVDV